MLINTTNINVVMKQVSIHLKTNGPPSPSTFLFKLQSQFKSATKMKLSFRNSKQLLHMRFFMFAQSFLCYRCCYEQGDASNYNKQVVFAVERFEIRKAKCNSTMSCLAEARVMQFKLELCSRSFLSQISSATILGFRI